MGRPAISKAKLKWLFRSRSTGKLNAVSYWLLALIAACLLDAALFLGWRLAEQFGRDVNYSDWVESRFPNDLRGYSGSQLTDRLEDLVKYLQYGDPSTSTSTSLVEADELKKKAEHGTVSCGAAASMFDESEISVYPACVSYTSGGEPSLSATEIAVFQRFATYMTKMYKDKGPDAIHSKHTERSLAESLGFTDPYTMQADFDIPWVYVASPSGAVAVFPANTEISRPFDPKSRPWWEAAFTTATHLSSKGLRDATDLLTVTYLDILVKRPILVRTYLTKFPVTGQAEDFVVGIDFHRRNDQSPLLSRMVSHQIQAAPGIVIFGLSLMFTVLGFSILRSSSDKGSKHFAFERLPESSSYGMLDVQRSAQATHGASWAGTTGAGLGVNKILGAKLESTTQKTDIAEVSTTIKRSQNTLRGLEKWRALYITRRSWRLVGLQFQSIRSTPFGELEVTYTNAILPSAKWIGDVDDRLFSEAEAEVYKKKLPSLLEVNADSVEGNLLELDSSGTPSSVRLDHIPEWVRLVADNEELLAIRHKRAYVTLSSARLDDLYSKAEVKAVILSSYFERLLENGQTDFLLKGRTIRRLVSFPDDEAGLGLSTEAQNRYRALLADYSPVSSRVLRRVNESIDIEGIYPQPVYDFAILNDEMLVVAHVVTETSVVDMATGRIESPAYRVEGYLSWRTPDIEFYRALFDALAGRAKLMPRADQVAAAAVSD